MLSGANLDGAILTDVRWPEGVRVPDGWMAEGLPGRLKRAGQVIRGNSPGSPKQVRLTRPDVQAAVTVVGRRDTERDIRPIDLTGADLTAADLTAADLTGADLTRANLTDVRWPEGVPVPEGWLVDDKSSARR